MRIPSIIPMKGRGFINQGSGLSLKPNADKQRKDLRGFRVRAQSGRIGNLSCGRSLRNDPLAQNIRSRVSGNN